MMNAVVQLSKGQSGDTKELCTFQINNIAGFVGSACMIH